jgi:hypothetical protein
MESFIAQYPYEIIFRVLKPWKMRLEVHVARMGVKQHAHKALNWKREGNNYLEDLFKDEKMKLN